MTVWQAFTRPMDEPSNRPLEPSAASNDNAIPTTCRRGSAANRSADKGWTDDNFIRS